MTDHQIVTVPVADLPEQLASLAATYGMNAWVAGTNGTTATVELIPPTEPGQVERVREWAAWEKCSTCDAANTFRALAAHINASHGYGLVHLVEDASAWVQP